MSAKRTTKISWTQHSWNPIHGCSKVSEGCRNCYAERISLKMRFTDKPWTNANVEANVQLKPHKLSEPARIKDPSMIFVNSMSDLFHPAIPKQYIERVFEVMNTVNHHTYQVLTKRPERAAEFSWPFRSNRKFDEAWPKHVWLGTSAEDQATAEQRILHLLRSFAQVKFLSLEPLLGPITMEDIEGADQLDWIIVGGESAHHSRRREMSHAWVWPIYEFCKAHDIPFFFKQSSAHRTEMGTTLAIGPRDFFYKIQQYPGDLRKPEIGQPHDHAHWDAPALDTRRRSRKTIS